VHKNPLIRNVVFNQLKQEDNILLLEPLDYQEMANLIAASTLLLTDSGGIQEEAPTLGKPVLVLRSETERPEVVDIGAAKLIGTEKMNIIKEVASLLSNTEEYQKMIIKKSPYGDGNASKRIIEYILFQYGLINRPPDEFVF
jgi:UDP-N-acetylglucosamine 2-epimerase (non-hydrolysing)